MLILASRSPQRRAILEQIGVPFEAVDSAVEELDAGEPPLVVVENALRKARAVAAARWSDEYAVSGESGSAVSGSGEFGSAVSGDSPAAASGSGSGSGDSVSRPSGSGSGDPVSRPSGSGALGTAASGSGALGTAADLVLGADTIISHAGEVVGKPPDADAARVLMRRLSGEAHQVLGGIALIGRDGGERTACVATDVVFRELEDAEIDRYVVCGEWRDRSGGYAIQQKGATLVERIEGDYLNIVGLSVVALLRLAPELRV